MSFFQDPQKKTLTASRLLKKKKDINSKRLLNSSCLYKEPLAVNVFFFFKEQLLLGRI
jgi:hypothetical protein